MKTFCIYKYLFIDITSIASKNEPVVGRVFANGPGDRGSIPGWVIPKTLKMVLDTSLHYKVCIKGKV